MFFHVAAHIRTRQHDTARLNIREPYVGQSNQREHKVNVEAETLRKRSGPQPRVTGTTSVVNSCQRLSEKTSRTLIALLYLLEADALRSTVSKIKLTECYDGGTNVDTRLEETYNGWKHE